MLTTRQNLCLQGVCKCSISGVTHFVFDEIQYGEGGVRLAVFDCSDSPCQRTSGCTHACCHTLLQDRCPSSSQGNELTPASAQASAQVAALLHVRLQNQCDETFLSCFCLYEKTSRLRLVKACSSRSVRCIPSSRGPPRHSASEHVDCASNGVRNNLTPYELLHDCVPEDRTAG